MEELDLLREQPPAESRSRLLSLARGQGAQALPILQAALAMPALADAAIEALAEVPSQGAWDALEGIAREGPVGLRKAARRAQHRLRSRGFAAQATAPAPAPGQPVELAQASFFDHSGGQLLRLLRPAALGLARFASFIVGPAGLLECTHTLASRTDLEAALAAEDREVGENLVDAGLPYVARRVHQAVERSRAAGQALPQRYPEAARLLEGAPEDALLEYLAAARKVPATLTQAAILVRHPSMARWLFLDEQMSPYAEEWLRLAQIQPARTEEGLPNLAAVQSRGQMMARIIGEVADAAALQRLAEQLAEQGRLLAAQGERILAEVAMSCAAGMAEHPGPDNPFLRALVDESMQILVHAIQERQSEEARGPWVPAGDGPGALWVPRPAEPEKGPDEKKPASRLWVPGRQG